MTEFNERHSERHWVAAKRVLRYLKGTADYRLRFKQTGNFLKGYVDANFSSTNKSYTGFVFMLGGAPISWESKKQKRRTKSTTASEYVALSESACQGVYLRNLFKELLGIAQPVCLDIYCDNQPAIKLASNRVHGHGIKYLEVDYHIVREFIELKEIEVNYVGSGDNIADVLTKPLCLVKHNNCVSEMCYSVK